MVVYHQSLQNDSPKVEGNTLGINYLQSLAQEEWQKKSQGQINNVSFLVLLTTTLFSLYNYFILVFYVYGLCVYMHFYALCACLVSARKGHRSL